MSGEDFESFNQSEPRIVHDGHDIFQHENKMRNVCRGPRENHLPRAWQCPEASLALKGLGYNFFFIFFFISCNQKQKLVMAAMFVAESIQIYLYQVINHLDL